MFRRKAYLFFSRLSRLKGNTDNGNFFESRVSALSISGSGSDVTSMAELFNHSASPISEENFFSGPLACVASVAVRFVRERLLRRLPGYNPPYLNVESKEPKVNWVTEITYDNVVTEYLKPAKT